MRIARSALQGPPGGVPRVLASSSGDSSYIFISNLGDAVTEEDLRELFSSIGPLKKCAMKFDRVTGRAVGLADVIYERPEHARQAFNTYKNAKLDGKPMVLEMRSMDGGAGGAGG